MISTLPAVADASKGRRVSCTYIVTHELALVDHVLAGLGKAAACEERGSESCDGDLHFDERS